MGYRTNALNSLDKSMSRTVRNRLGQNLVGKNYIFSYILQTFARYEVAFLVLGFKIVKINVGNNHQMRAQRRSLRIFIPTSKKEYRC